MCLVRAGRGFLPNVKTSHYSHKASHAVGMADVFLFTSRASLYHNHNTLQLVECSTSMLYHNTLQLVECSTNLIHSVLCTNTQGEVADEIPPDRTM
jgi:hypothetical protein